MDKGGRGVPRAITIIGRYWIIQKNILPPYLSYLFRLWLLSEKPYSLEALQSVDKTKTHPKAYITHPLLPETEATAISVYF